MALFIHPLDPSEFGVFYTPAQSLGWKTVWPDDFDDMDKVIKEYIQEIRVDGLINRLDKQTNCDLIILEC